MRFRFAELLSVISVGGIALAAILQPTSLRESVFVSLTMLITLFAGAMAIGRRNAERSFWLGFAFTAVLYLSFSGVNKQMPRTAGAEITTQTLNWIFDTAHADASDDLFGPDGGYGGNELDDLFGESSTDNTTLQIRFCAYGGGTYGGGGGGYGGGEIAYAARGFYRIGHCAWALVLAWLMGHLTQFIYLRSHSQNAPHAMGAG